MVIAGGRDSRLVSPIKPLGRKTSHPAQSRLPSFNHFAILDTSAAAGLEGYRVSPRFGAGVQEVSTVQCPPLRENSAEGLTYSARTLSTDRGLEGYESPIIGLLFD